MTQYIDMRSIFEIMVVEERGSGSRETMCWWEQEGIRFGDEGRGTDEFEVDQ